MNKSLWFSSPRKTALTLLNIVCICIGIVLVSYINPLSGCLLNYLSSAVLDFILQGKRSATILRVRVSHVQTTLELSADHLSYMYID